MNTVKRNILEQLICGPQANKALFKTVKDVVNIENLLKRMNYRCLCKLNTKETGDLNDTEDKANPTFKRESADKSVNTDDTDWSCSCKKEDKETNCDPIDQDNYFISKRRGNCIRAAEFSDCNKNNHDMEQIHRITSTSEITFVGDIAYPEEIWTDDSNIQNNQYCRCKNTFQVTSVCVSYKNERTANELDKLPKLNSVTEDYNIETNIYNENLHDIKEVGQKSYMTKIHGVNIVAETKTNYNSDELKVIFNDEITSTYTTTGYSPQAESNVIAFKQEIFDQVKKVATQIIRNFHKERETNVISPLIVPEHIYI
uniref:Uncharacterized protein n=2 Tax=Rhodnius prolixus TaxID=13249 RepID=T1IEZ6_RHOPR